MLCALSQFLDRGNNNNDNNNSTNNGVGGDKTDSSLVDVGKTLNNNNNNNNHSVFGNGCGGSINSYASSSAKTKDCGGGSNHQNSKFPFQDGGGGSSSSSGNNSKDYFRHNRRHLPVPHGPYTVGSVDLMCDLSDHGAFFRMYYPTTPAEDIHTHYKQWPLWLPRKQYAWGFVLFLKKSKKIFGRLANWLGGDVYVPSLWQAPLLREDKRYPVIIVSHGIGGNRTYLSSYCMELASHGFVVAALEHRDGSASMTLCLEEQLKSSIRDSSVSEHYDHYGSDYNLHESKCKDILNNSCNGAIAADNNSSSSSSEIDSSSDNASITTSSSNNIINNSIDNDKISSSDNACITTSSSNNSINDKSNSINCNNNNNNSINKNHSEDKVNKEESNNKTNSSTATTTTTTSTPKTTSSSNNSHSSTKSGKKPRLRKCRSAAAALREYFSDDGDNGTSSNNSGTRNILAEANTNKERDDRRKSTPVKTSTTTSTTITAKDKEEDKEEVQFRSWDRRRNKKQRSLRQQESCSEEWRPFQHISVWDDFDFRNNQMYYRSHEISEVLDELVAINEGRHINNALGLAFKTAQFKNRLDLSRVAVVGHSFGAASALATLNQDKRFITGISLDAWLHPVDDMVYNNTKQPTLFLNMEQFQWERNIKQILRFIGAKPEADRPLLTLMGGCHQSVTDFQFLVPQVVGRFLDVCWTLQPEIAMATCVTTSLAFLCKQFRLPMEQHHVDALEGKNPHLMVGTNVDLTVPDPGPTPP